MLKKCVGFMFAVLAFASAFTACQATPEDPAVIGKDVEKMLETAQREDEPAAGADIDLYVRLGAPEHYSAEVKSKEGRITVFADADVHLPQAELPIVRVRPAIFSLEQAKVFADVLLGSDAHYVEYDDDHLPRAVYEKRIEKLRAGLADWENVGQYEFDLVYYTKQEAEEGLRELIAKAANAPESLPYHAPEFVWSKPSVYTEEGEAETESTYLFLWAMPDDATFSRFDVNNNLYQGVTASMWYDRDHDVPIGGLPTDVTDISNKLSVSESDAFALAEKTVKALGIEGLTCSARQQTFYHFVRTDPPAFYQFMFTREFDGITETYTNADQNNDPYNAPWYYEKLHVLVDDGGVLCLRYEHPYETVETVMDKTELLPFETIQGIFKKMVVIVGNEIDTNPIWEDGAKEYHITSVRLGLVNVREPNSDTGLLVPAWDFMGCERGRIQSDKPWNVAFTNELQSFLTVNAIDGSIIERGQ
ncbi:MAG TPA: DUF6034 family protein [Clostridia bacterium]|nr:DUF6034 family protein [Clostridia bacterium]